MSIHMDNKAYAKRLKQALWNGTRQVVLNASSSVLVGISMATYQDTSNAAYNWSFDLNGKFSPFRRYTRPPVGKLNDKRTDNAASDLMSEVAYTRAGMEKRRMHGYLYAKKFSGQMPRFNDFSLVNPVEDESKLYAYNAEIDKHLVGAGQYKWDWAVSAFGSIEFAGVV